MINKKMKSSLEKIQSICNDELQVLKKDRTIENLGNNTVQPNPLPIPKRHLEGGSNDTNKSERNR